MVEVVNAESRLQQVQGRQITILFHSPLTQMNEKYWSFSFLISILSPNFDKEWNVRKFDLDFYHFLNEKYQTDKVQY